MSIYYKFKSAKDYDSVAIDSQFIFVGQLKEKIFELKKYGRGIDYDLVVSNAQTNEEYVDEGMLIPKNTSVLIRRVPGPPRMPIKTAPPVSEQQEPNVETNPSAMRNAEEDEFGNDVYAIPETVPAHSSILGASKEEEESKTKALIETSAFGRGGGFEKKMPPQGYTCHRCKVPGHFIQHCPTNGDPNYDVGSRVNKPPTGIPKMALSGGAVTRPVPPELHCPLCKQVMKDAVLTSKCCFASFCDTCMRDYIVSKARCVCGATNVVADDLLPNKTLRDTINRILESRNPPTQSAASKGQDKMPVVPPLPQQEKGTSDEEVPVSSGEAAGKKKKTKKVGQEFPPENYMMPFAPCAFDPYWNGGFDGFMPPCGGPMPYMSGYGGFGGFNPLYDPYSMLPYGPPLPQPPITSRDEFQAPRADLKRKRETERREEERQDGEYGSSRGYVSSRSTPPSDDHHRHRSWSRDVVLPRPSSKKKYEHKIDRFVPKFSNNRPVLV